MQKINYFVLTQGEKYIRKLEALIANNSLVGDTPFFEVNQFSWVKLLEDNWTTIRAELDNILQSVETIPNFQDLSPDQYSITQDDRWKTFFFYAYGFKSDINCQKCPHTTSLIEQIPGMTTAFFSILLPGKHIPEHYGPYKGVLRYHLALKVPQPITSCAIRVQDQICHWQEGKSLIFDDTFAHEAWNYSDEIRVVLFIDFIRPLRFPVSWLNLFLIKLISLSPLVQEGKRNFESLINNDAVFLV